MNTAMRSAILGMVAALGIGAAAQAVTVASVDVPLGQFDGLFYKTTQAGNYTLDFSWSAPIGEVEPLFLGAVGYVFIELDSLFELLVALADVDPILVQDGQSIPLGFLDAGTDFAAGLVTLGGSTTMSLNLVDAPAPIPLPASLPLLAAAIGAAGLAGRRRQAA